jgi:hypothetical protein
MEGLFGGVEKDSDREKENDRNSIVLYCVKGGKRKVQNDAALAEQKGWCWC